MDNRTEFDRNNIKTKHIKIYKIQEDVENHDHLRPETTPHIKKSVFLFFEF